MESKPQESIVSRSEISERFHFTQCKSNIGWKDFKELRCCQASGIAWISAKFLKDIAPVIAIYLVNNFNLSIKPDAFPSQCKIAKIKNLFRIRIKTEAKSYRHISLLPLLSKVIEKSIHDQTED